jgi:PAS domain-containing protein
MSEAEMIPRQRADRRQLQQIIAGLTEGVILVDPDQSIVWANEAALAMHGVETREELGSTVTEYRQRFVLPQSPFHKGRADGGREPEKPLHGGGPEPFRPQTRHTDPPNSL